VAKRLGYLSDTEYSALEIQIKQVGAPLSGLLRAAHSLPVAAATAGAVVGGAIVALLLQ
jgi:hypothetical protein